MVEIFIGDNSDPNDNPNSLVFKIVNCIASVLYAAIMLGSFALLIKIGRTQAADEEGLSLQRLFLSLIAVHTFARCVFFGLVTGVAFSEPLQNLPIGFWFVFSTLPFDMFCSIFTLLIYIWAKIYHWSQGAHLHKRLVIGLNIFLYGAQLAEYALYFLEADTLKITEETKIMIRNIVTFLVMGSFSICLSISIFIYGLRVIFMFRRLTELQQGVKTIYLVCGICTTCFLYRGILLYLDYWISLDWTFTLVYIVPSEILPLLLMLYVFNQSPAVRNSHNENTSSYLGGKPKYTLLINKDVR